ncbi:MAG: branched-chain amino acid ABC transporter permease, partial [Deltaproteobacteria bacterium]|nr:branched-chain amino acid ABC transporter permease [Deltaproteobacteria bacterium]
METAGFILIQLLNGVQYGLLLFLLSTGLTLVFGVMGIINLAHGSFYMLGAYAAHALAAWGLGFPAVLLLALVGSVTAGLLTEVLTLRHVSPGDHLGQVLLTFGLILIFNESMRLFFGPEIKTLAIPDYLDHTVRLFGPHHYPAYRLFATGFGLAAGAGLWVLINRTRLGMIIRAGAENREMVEALGIGIRPLFSLVFALGAGLAAASGIIAAPIVSIYPGMGEEIIILTFVVVVVGGLGSLKGALLASLLIGVADTFGKSLLPELSSVMAYALMALVLLLRPQGLF